MDASYAPYEWVQGRSATAWWIGFGAILFGGIFSLPFVLRSVVPPSGFAFDPANTLLYNLAAVGIAVAAVLFYGMFVPLPLEWLGIAPAGVRVGSNEIRPILVPWSQLLLDGDRLVVIHRRTQVATVYRLTRSQVQRLEWARGILAPPSGQVGAGVRSASSS